ncbi:hypothetical protein WJX82_009117 [Trebouxia sp. C0006]
MKGYARRAATGWLALLLTVLLVVIQTQPTAGWLAHHHPLKWPQTVASVAVAQWQATVPKWTACSRTL